MEIVVGAPADSYGLEPAINATVGMFAPANASIFESLTAPTPAMTLEPGLATEWEFVEPDVWRFTLRQGVVFHNGEPFNAAAVVDTVNNRLAEQGYVRGVQPGAATEVDEFTVDIRTEPLNFRLPRDLANPYYAMVAPGTFPGDGSTPESTPTGTGPLQFESYQNGEELVVSRFDDYWGEPAVPDRVTFRFFPDDGSRLLALRAGDVDAIIDVPRSELASLEGDPDVELAISEPGAYYTIFFNSHGSAPHDLLSEAAVRRAVALATDTASIVDTVWAGSAVENQAYIPVEIMGQENVDLVEGIPFDPDEARRLLDEAGWVEGPDGIRTRDGRSLSLSLVPYILEEEEPLPELFQAQLRDVGIGVEIEPLAGGTGWGDVIRSGEWDMTSTIANAGIEHSGGPIGWMTPSVGGDDAGAEFVSPGPDFDAMAAAVPSVEDDDEYHRLLGELYHIALDEYVAAISFAGISRVYGLSPEVQGFEPFTFSASQTWHRVSIE